MPKKSTADTATETNNSLYQEWRCEIKTTANEDGGNITHTLEKVKMLRDNVNITDEEAEVLNAGAKNSPRTDYVIAYFKPE